MGAKNLTSVTEFILLGLTSHRKTQLLLFSVFLLIYSLTLVGNLLIIILVLTNSHLHTPMYFFLTHLSGLEVCYVTSTMPQMLAHLLSGNGAISFTRCMLQMYISLFLGCSECFLLGVMAYDRYLAICHPLTYAILMGRWRLLQLASVSWGIPVILTVVNVLCTLCFSFCGPKHVNHFFCELPVVMKLACGDTRVAEAILFVTAMLALLPPLSIILTSYGLILSSVLRMQSTSGRHKAFSTCASHLAVVTMFYGTIISMYMRPQSVSAPDQDKKTAVFYIVITPLLNPIIYTLRNKDIHRAVKKTLRKTDFEQKY
ncbi:PREDICTED: olfactory receptor 5V1-like [Gekko japonicus]|uniref:Olfactory receptor n=1 Tax=Gekko japonicus TaxID=146911 RepID=A0ABM1K3C8_GEKJA|nr:PREDICTED: olfactory receptor 5V1-like [Gekko japonicus]